MGVEPRVGLWMPLATLAFCTLIGAVGLDRYGAHVQDEQLTWSGERVLDAMVASDGSVDRLQALDGIKVDRIVDDPAPRKYRFLWSLRGEEALDPANVDDAALVEVYLAARKAAVVRSESDHLKVARTHAGAVLVARVDRGRDVGTLPFYGGILLGLILCLGMMIWRGTGIYSALLGALAAFVPVAGGAAWAAHGLTLQAHELATAVASATGLQAPFVSNPAGVIGLAGLPLVLMIVLGIWTRSRASANRVAYTYLMPAAVGMGLLVLVPFIVGVALAFMRHDMGTFTWVGLANFGQILSSEGYGLTHPLSFYFTLAVTIGWTAINVVLHVGIGLALALVLQRPTLRFRGVYRVLLIVPWAVPSYITALIWKGMFDKQYGMINHVFGVIGLEPVAWFNGFWTAFTANVTTNTWLGFPFMMVVCLGALQSIPRDLYEAADVDGASAWAKFRHITLPLLKPALLPAVILGSVWTFNMFNVIYLVSNGQPHHSTDILITEAYRWAFEQDRYGYAAAYSVIIFLVLLSYSLLTQRVTKAAEEAYG